MSWSFKATGTPRAVANELKRYRKENPAGESERQCNAAIDFVIADIADHPPQKWPPGAYLPVNGFDVEGMGHADSTGRNMTIKVTPLRLALDPVPDVPAEAEKVEPPAAAALPQQ